MMTTSNSVSKSSRKNKRRSRRNSDASSLVSLPDYRVEEDKYGRLVNKERNLVWPALNPGDTISMPDETETEFSQLSTSSNCFEADAFIGGVTKSNAENRIGHRSFVIYYRMPDDGTIPFSMPLMLVYRSSSGAFYHFAINQKKQFDKCGKVGRMTYKVECGDTLDFLSMESLIRHYDTFVYHDVSTGSMETFPVGSKDGCVYDVYK